MLKLIVPAECVLNKYQTSFFSPEERHEYALLISLGIFPDPVYDAVVE